MRTSSSNHLLLAAAILTACSTSPYGGTGGMTARDIKPEVYA
jgi:hypothetical protein